MALAALAGCPPEESSAQRPSRVDVGRPTGAQAASTASADEAARAAAEKLCDHAFPLDRAPAATLPPLVAGRAGGAPTPAFPADRWVWLNVWATWCKPCLREMPLLRRWQEQMRRAGAGWDLWLVSIDESAAELETFLVTHPELQGDASLRLADPTQLGPWANTLGLPVEASVPIQVILAPGGRVRCVRAGGVGDEHLPLVRALLGAPAR